MPIGINILDCHDIDKLCTTSNTIHVLGIDSIQDRKRIISSNFDPIIDNIKACLNIWSQRHLSLFSRIEVVKTLAISQLVYALTLLPSPNSDYLYQIERLLLQFIWSNKTAKIRSGILKSTKDVGDADMPDVKLKDSCLKLGSLGRLESLSGTWKDYIINMLPVLDVEYFLSCNLKYTDLNLPLKKRLFLG